MNPRPTAAREARRVYRDRRQAWYQHLREQGWSFAEAVADVGVSVRTGRRYEAMRRAGGGAE